MLTMPVRVHAALLTHTRAAVRVGSCSVRCRIEARGLGPGFASAGRAFHSSSRWISLGVTIAGNARQLHEPYGRMLISAQLLQFLAGKGRHSRALCSVTEGSHSFGEETTSALPPSKEHQKHSLKVVQLGSPWDEVQRWVVFSDLHLSKRTKTQCIQVLEHVHRCAVEEDAGILFLGDFWHARGELPVEPLNAAVKCVQTWTQPSIMITGNHDQVTLGGEEHALTAVAAANELVAVFSEPCLYRNALWLPYRRKHEQLTAFLEECTRQDEDRTRLRAVFCHVDVQGASYNDVFQAQIGMAPSSFPKSIPTYTGHYHKPHIVPNTNIIYVGSPYQLTLAESKQEKRFLLLGSEWEHLLDIPVNIGPQHHTIDLDHIGETSGIESGDYVRIHLPAVTERHEYEEQAQKIKQMKDAGINVEVIQSVCKQVARLEMKKFQSAPEVLAAYAKLLEMPSKVSEAAHRILGDLPLHTMDAQRRAAQVTFDLVELEGYGPFQRKVSYPLKELGIRVVTGKNMDDTGFASNGAGKTMLVMAPLWALTGRTDPRVEGNTLKGLQGVEVKNADAKFASVTLHGTINGKVFKVHRRIGKRVKQLSLVVDGADLTRQDMKLTQEEIDSMIDTSLLDRTVFLGQHSFVGSLLEATDKELKDELGRLTNIHIWRAARDATGTKLKAISEEKILIEGNVIAQRSFLERMENELRIAKEYLADESHSLAQKESELEAHLGYIQEKLTEYIEQQLVPHMEEIAFRCRFAHEHILNECLVDEDESSAISAPTVRESSMTSNFTSRIQQLQQQLSQQEKERGAALIAKVNAETALTTLEGRLASVFEGDPDEMSHDSLMEDVVCEQCLQPVNRSLLALRREQLKKERDRSAEAFHKYSSELAAIETAVEKTATALEEFRSAQVRQAELEKGMAIDRERSLTTIREALSEAERSVRQTLTQCLPKVLDALQDKIPSLINLSAFENSIEETAIARVNEVLNATGTEAKVVAESQDIEQLAVGLTELASGMQTVSSTCFEGAQQMIATAAELQSVREEQACLDHLPSCLSSTADLHPKLKQVQRLAKLQEECELEISDLGKKALSLEEDLLLYKEVEKCFGLNGIQSYVVEDVLSELQTQTAKYMAILSGGTLQVSLSATKPLASNPSSRPREIIDRKISIRTTSGELVTRTLRQLSGGERRRVAIGAALAYADVVSNRCGLDVDLLVLDEFLQYLDEVGKGRVVELLRHREISLRKRHGQGGTVLVVVQPDDKLPIHLANVDIICKQNGCSSIQRSTGSST